MPALGVEGERLPDVLRHVRQDRGHHGREAHEHSVEHRLARPTPEVVRARYVQPWEARNGKARPGKARQGTAEGERGVCIGNIWYAQALFLLTLVFISTRRRRSTCKPRNCLSRFYMFFLGRKMIFRLPCTCASASVPVSSDAPRSLTRARGERCKRKSA